MHNVESVLGEDTDALAIDVVGHAPQSVVIMIGMLSYLPCVFGDLGQCCKPRPDDVPNPTIAVTQRGNDNAPPDGITLLFIAMNRAHGITDADIVATECATGKRVNTVVTAYTSQETLTCDNYQLVYREIALIFERVQYPMTVMAVLTSAPLAVAYMIGTCLSPCAYILDRERMGADIVVAGPPMIAQIV
jgi:hypothetical protein